MKVSVVVSFCVSADIKGKRGEESHECKTKKYESEKVRQREREKNQ